MPTQHLIRTRLTVLFFTLLSLAVAGLNSAIAHFLLDLRDRVRSDSFQTLQNCVIATVLMATATTAFAIYGTVIAVHPRWVREHNVVWSKFTAAQITLGFCMIIVGACLASVVHGFDTPFETFGYYDSIPHYSLMYYGSVAQAAYGSFLGFLAITVVALLFAVDCYQTKRNWAEASARVEVAQV
ncbi:hypothetical protein NKR23_g9018 [Pleurostoma richardsiae]|uniref:Uncharacterized protein n=1 Tax=Pleurostoma richardsiae TaxID=41990 RepID=A0AA38VCG9_9PEZI|nr:hypothetical protein NKR23_g9018 [Pleurostoma richardsiae]